MTKPVRHPGGGCGCGCDDDACEYSRVRDSYSVAVLRELPAPYTTPMRQPPMTAIYPCGRRTAPACPPCPPEPWVVLADVIMGDDCSVLRVDCFAHRRHVVTFAEFFWVCPGLPGATTGISVGVRPNLVAASHMMSAMTGTAALVDVGEALSMEPPRAMVTMRRIDGSAVTVPAHFVVQPGESLGDLLNREGDRELYDPASGTTVTLRTLYADAGVAATEPLANAAAALALLEGKTLRATSEPATTGEPGEAPPAALRELLDARAFARLRDDPSRPATALGVDALHGFSATSRLGRRMKDMTIGDVGAMTENAFMARVTEGTSGKVREELQARARETWALARRVVDAVEGEPR